jgi:hypothetical protein
MEMRRYTAMSTQECHQWCRLQAPGQGMVAVGGMERLTCSVGQALHTMTFLSRSTLAVLEGEGLGEPLAEQEEA